MCCHIEYWIYSFEKIGKANTCNIEEKRNLEILEEKRNLENLEEKRNLKARKKKKTKKVSMCRFATESTSDVSVGLKNNSYWLQTIVYCDFLSVKF